LLCTVRKFISESKMKEMKLMKIALEIFSATCYHH